METMFDVQGAQWDNPKVPTGYRPEEWKAQRAQHLMAQTAEIENRQKALHELNLWNATLYCNRQLTGFNWGVEPLDQDLVPSNLITENLVLSIGDAMLSRANTSPTRVKPTPRGADFSTYRLVKKLDRWLQGMWRDLKAEDVLLECFLDAFISGLGTCRVDWDPHRKKLCLERVFFDNVIIDNSECANSDTPRIERIRMVVPCRSLEERYGVEFTGEEKRAAYSDYRSIGDGWMPVVEAWKRAGDDGKPGRHTVAAGNQLLIDEPWPHDWTPLVHFHWSRRTQGFYRAGGIEQVVPYQIRLNEVNDVIRDAQDLASRMRLLVHSGSMVDVNAIDNVIGRIIKYTGIEPKAVTWPAVNAELYSERERTVRSCFEFFGMSQMTAQAQLPTGVRLDSSAAVREFRVQEDQRFLDLWRRFETSRVDIAQAMINVMTTVSGGDYSTTWRVGGRWVEEEIKWSEVAELNKQHYTWSLEAVSIVDMTPAARQDTLDTFVSKGYTDPQRAGVMTGNPDLEDVLDMETAPRDEIKRQIEVMEDGDYEAPDVTNDLIYGLWAVEHNVNRLKKFKNVPDEVIESHQRWLRQALALQQPAVEQENQQAAADQIAAAAPAPVGPSGPMTAPLQAPGPAMAPIQ